MVEGGEYRLCSVVSVEAGDDPAGSATPFESCLMVEVAPPYPRDAIEARRLPEGLRKVIEGAMDAGLIQKFGAFMPDREYSEKGRTRVFLFRRPEGPFTSFEKEELLVPGDDAAPAVEALLAGDASRFARYRETSSATREVFVCTHNNRDVCCGRFGDPVYKELRKTCAGEDLRVWRTSHLGGHRFAATLVDFPSGAWWGHLDRDTAKHVVLRDADPAALRRFYRGWSGLGSSFEQIADREALAREGWRWMTFSKAGKLLDANEDRAEVRIEYTDPDTGEEGAYTATLEASGSVMTLASSGTDPLEEARQYRVSHLEKHRK